MDLGDAAPIDGAVEAAYTLRDPNRTDTKRLAGTGSTGGGPIRRRLGTTRHLLLCPDGALNLIPFGALVDDQNRYLVEAIRSHI